MAKKRGTPTKYQKALGNLIGHMMAQGCTNEEIATKAGISVLTLRKWRESQGDIAIGVKETKNIVSEMIELSLIDLCLGYTVKTKDENGNEKIHSHIKPDLSAIRHWQRCRDPENWMEEQKLEIEMNKPIKLDLSNATEDELMDAIKSELRKDRIGKEK